MMNSHQLLDPPLLPRLSRNPQKSMESRTISWGFPNPDRPRLRFHRDKIDTFTLRRGCKYTVEEHGRGTSTAQPPTEQQLSPLYQTTNSI
jgi:hypothetical protein